MAWTSPRSWAVGEVVTATHLNTHVRDNLNWLGGAAGRGTVLPSSPVDGQEFTYEADAATGILWRLKYRASSTYWEWVGGTELFTVSNTGVNMGTTMASTGSGPTYTLPLEGDYVVDWGGDMEQINGQGTYGVAAVALHRAGVSQHQKVAASAALNSGTLSNYAGSVHGVTRLTGCTAAQVLEVYAGTTYGTVYYRSTDRYLAVRPVRVR